MSNRDVSNKKIMDSYQGILRISPESLADDGLPDSGTRVVSDSKGNNSSLSLGKNDTAISNKLSLDNVSVSGSLGGSLLVNNSFSFTGGANTSVSFNATGM